MLEFITEAGKYDMFYNEDTDNYEVHNSVSGTLVVTFDTLQEAEDFVDLNGEVIEDGNVETTIHNTD